MIGWSGTGVEQRTRRMNEWVREGKIGIFSQWNGLGC